MKAANPTAIADAIATFPATFGLRAFPDLTFRLSERSSYINDSGAVTLYTQVLRDGKWGDFAKGSAPELRREVVADPNAPAPVVVTASVTVSDELIINALDSADIGYWARVPEGADHAEMLAGRDKAIVVELEGPHDGKGDGRHDLTGEKVRQGIAVMAAKYPTTHFADLLADNADAITGDVLVQCALFGDLIYG